jgi:hypothetical protein
MGTERSFRKAGRGLKCRVCLFKRSVHSHHVIYEQELRNRGLPIFDRRNCMAICKTCHERHHTRARIIPVASIADETLEYAFEVLGLYAYDYLRRVYEPHDLGDRLVQMFRAEQAKVAQAA